MNTEAIKELKRLAEAATPGPWEVYNDNEGMEQCYSPLWCLANDSWHNASDESAPCFQMAIYSGVKEDADWIAAANPAAIKSLIAQLEAAQAELAAIRSMYKKEHTARVNCMDMRKEICDSYEETKAELAAIRALEPVAEVVWFEPDPYWKAQRTGKIVDASHAFFDGASIGTKLYALPEQK